MGSKKRIILAVFTCAMTMSATVWAQGIDNTGLNYNNTAFEAQQRQILLNRIRSKQEKAIKSSRYNFYVNETLYKKIQNDINKQQINYNKDNLRSLMAYLSDSPDADCSYGKKQSGAVQYKYGRKFMAVSGSYTYGIICKSQISKTKHQVFFGGVPKFVLTDELSNYMLSSYGVNRSTAGSAASGSSSASVSSSGTSSSGNVTVIQTGQQTAATTSAEEARPADSMYDQYMNQNRIVLGSRQSVASVAFQDEDSTQPADTSTSQETSLTPATIANPTPKPASQPTVFVEATH